MAVPQLALGRETLLPPLWAVGPVPQARATLRRAGRHDRPALRDRCPRGTEQEVQDLEVVEPERLGERQPLLHGPRAAKPAEVEHERRRTERVEVEAMTGEHGSAQLGGG